MDRTRDRRPVALVTGGTRGIGLGIAHALAHDGWDLVLTGVRSPEDVAPTLETLRQHQAGVEYVPSDVASRADRAALVDTIGARYTALNAIVNNAGRAPRVRADLLDADEDSFDSLIKTNLQGPYFLTQALARAMVARKRDDHRFRAGIVFVTSVSAEMASPNRGEYCVSKAGLAMAVKLFALRLAEHDIPVYEVRPGIIATDMTAAVREIYDRRIAEGLIPQQRWGSPDDVGRAVAALLRGDLHYATGTIVHVDGGLSVPRL